MRYGIGVWRDLVDAQGDAIQVSSQGAFGFSPGSTTSASWSGCSWSRIRRNVYGLVEQMQQMIRDILDATPCNTPPTVTITSPANGASFTAPARITISTSAPDCDGAIHKVEFYAGTRLLGTDTSSPYRFRWNNVPAGSYTLTAKASDNQSAATVSSPVSITVRRR